MCIHISWYRSEHSSNFWDTHRDSNTVIWFAFIISFIEFALIHLIHSLLHSDFRGLCKYCAFPGSPSVQKKWGVISAEYFRIQFLVFWSHYLYLYKYSIQIWAYANPGHCKTGHCNTPLQVIINGHWDYIHSWNWGEAWKSKQNAIPHELTSKLIMVKDLKKIIYSWVWWGFKLISAVCGPLGMPLRKPGALYLSQWIHLGYIYN